MPLPDARKRFPTPSECPVCGADVPANARACPECGADEQTGWNEDASRYDGLDLPDPDFDYEGTLENEGLKPKTRPRGTPAIWWIIGVILALLIALLGAGA